MSKYRKFNKTWESKKRWAKDDNDGCHGTKDGWFSKKAAAHFNHCDDRADTKARLVCEREEKDFSHSFKFGRNKCDDDAGRPAKHDFKFSHGHRNKWDAKKKVDVEKDCDDASSNSTSYYKNSCRIETKDFCSKYDFSKTSIFFQSWFDLKKSCKIDTSCDTKDKGHSHKRGCDDDAPAELGSISGTFFCDNNQNDIDDAGDGDVAGQKVTLRNKYTGEKHVTYTDEDGNYSFTDLKAGKYQVFFTGVDGKEFVQGNVGSDDTIDSDHKKVLSSGVAATTSIRLKKGEDITDIDAGVVGEAPQPGALSGTYFLDANENDVQDAGDAGVANVRVTLLDANGVPTGDVVFTDAKGDYVFDDLAPGDYGVRFDDPQNVLADKELVDANDPNGNGDDTNDSDAVGDTTSSLITGIAVVAGQVTKHNDAGVKDANSAPIAADDTGMTCAGGSTIINLLEGDSDPDGDTLSVVAISDADETAAVGESITLESGASVTLNADGTVTYDSAGAHTDLVLNTIALDEFQYSLEDGNGGSAIGNVDVTVKGALNTVETISACLPESGVLEIAFPQPQNDKTYEVTVSGSGKLDGVYDGWCIDYDGRLAYLSEMDGDWYSSTSEDDLNALEAAGQLSEGAGENMDQVNWIINNTDALYADGFDQFQIQRAIWQLTDDFISSSPTEAAASQEIVDQAVDGYVPGEGELFGVIFAPTDISQTYDERGQTFIVAVPWEQLEEDCIC